MYRILTILFLANKSLITLGQNGTLNSFTNLEKTIKDWKYFLPERIMSVKVIAYSPALIFCGRSIENAMAIAIDNRGDSIRIIECYPGPKNILLGHSYKLYPDKKIPLDKNAKLILGNMQPNPFIFSYITIKNTTYGQLKSD